MYCEKVSFIQEMTFMVKVILKMHKVLSLTLKGLPFIDSRNVYWIGGKKKRNNQRLSLLIEQIIIISKIKFVAKRWCREEKGKETLMSTWGQKISNFRHVMDIQWTMSDGQLWWIWHAHYGPLGENYFWFVVVLLLLSCLSLLLLKVPNIMHRHHLNTCQLTRTE